MVTADIVDGVARDAARLCKQRPAPLRVHLRDEEPLRYLDLVNGNRPRVLGRGGASGKHAAHDDDECCMPPHSKYPYPYLSPFVSLLVALACPTQRQRFSRRTPSDGLRHESE